MGGDDLELRLRSVLDEVRAAGRGDELRGILEDFLRAPRPAPPGAPGTKGAPAPKASGDGTSDYTLRNGMVGSSEAMARVHELIERAGPTAVSVLVRGETGSGKELVARALHARSGRSGGFVAENCAAVAPSLLESELFGHAKGSFTGAVADRDGCFVTADGGTLFLDEIGDMPLDMQAKLLRVLETGEVRPVGSTRTRRVDVRVIAATHRDLAAMVAEKRFREDLLYRLDVVEILVPPLRERPEDVPELVAFFLERLGASDRTVAPDALEALARHGWPGNVRELENEMQRAVALSAGAIDRTSLSPALAAAGQEEGGRP